MSVWLTTTDLSLSKTKRGFSFLLIMLTVKWVLPIRYLWISLLWIFWTLTHSLLLFFKKTPPIKVSWPYRTDGKQNRRTWIRSYRIHSFSVPYLWVRRAMLWSVQHGSIIISLSNMYCICLMLYRSYLSFAAVRAVHNCKEDEKFFKSSQVIVAKKVQTFL